MKKKIAILLIEHSVNELYNYFSRLAVMDEGQIIYDGSMEKAWYALSERQNVGVREPQNVKLCRALGLQQLTVKPSPIVAMIRQKYQLVDADACVTPKNCLPEVILSAQNLSFTYPGSNAAILKSLSFELYKGEMVGLMGFNGAGKSTLMNLLGGLTKVQQGSIQLGSSSIQNALGRIGYLRQEPDLMLLADTVREELCWKNKAITENELQQLLCKLHLRHYANDFPLALSKGQRLRVVLGAMLAKKPELLLLDEPTTGQDEQSLQEIKQLLLDYKEQGGTVFICTHDVELAAEVTDRIIVLRQGEIIAKDVTSKVLSDTVLLKEGGLTPSSLLEISAALQLPPCTTVKEVQHYVR